jgi:Carboxypeptidase regulatory-like domain/TonB dependent receptor
MLQKPDVLRHMGTRAVALFAAVALLGMSASAFAQGAGAVIEGTVVDSQGAVLPGATLTLRNTDTGFTRTAVTEGDGRYRFAELPPGPYQIKAELQGFAPMDVKDITLTIGLSLRRDFTMRLQNLQESVVVTAEAPVVDVTKSEVAGVVTQQQIQTLPINSRQYLNLALLMPGTSQDAARPFYNNVNIGAGGSFYSNAFIVDGVRNTWAEQGEPRQDFPQDAVNEFKVNTTQYPAQYGLATGGLVNVVTKSGSNALHGDAFEYWRNRRLNAKNVFETTKPDFNRNQLGASAGGPIVQNKWHYFGAIERTQTDEFFTVNTGKPQFYSSVEGTFLKPSHRNLYDLRVDGQLTDSQTMFVRYAHEDELQSCFNCGGTNAANSGFDQTIPRRSVVFGHTWVQSSRRLNDFRFQYAYSMYQIAPAGTTIFTDVGNYPAARLNRIQRVLVFPSLTYGGNFDELGPEQRWEFNDTYTISIGDWHGSHDIRIGGEFHHIPFKDDSPGNLNGTYTFASDQFFNPNDPASVAALTNPILYTQQDVPSAVSQPTDYVGAYVQDDWKPRPNLTVSAGLRYDLQHCSFNECKNVADNLAQKPVTLPFVDLSARGDHNNFGPRLGVVYDITGDGRTVTRAGYGRYYDNIRTLINMFDELRDIAVRTIIVSNPPYPDPFLGQNPLNFISKAPPNITILANNFRNPSSDTVNGGVTRELGRDYAVSVDGVYTRVTGDRKVFNLNLADPGVTVRPLPQWGRIDQEQSTSLSKYRAMYVRFDKRQSRRTQFLVSYTLAKAEDNNPGARWVNQLNEGADFGPAAADRRHTLVVSGAVLAPYDVQVGAVWTLRSALPFNTIAGRDLNGDGFNTDYVPGTTRNQGNRDLNLDAVNAWRAANGRAPIPASQIDSSRFNSVDLRASKVFRFGGGPQIEALIQVFNVFNTVNLLAPFTSGQVTNALSDSFGRILSAKPGTQAELGARIVW